MTQTEIDAARRADILAGKPVRPKDTCNYCGWKVPKLAIWCSSTCATDYAKERDQLLAQSS